MKFGYSKDVSKQLISKFAKELKFYTKHVTDSKILEGWKNNVIRISALPTINIELLALTYIYNYIDNNYRDIFVPGMEPEVKSALLLKIENTAINENIVMMLINDVLPQMSQKKTGLHTVATQDQKKKKLLAHVTIYSYLIVSSL